MLPSFASATRRKNNFSIKIKVEKTTLSNLAKMDKHFVIARKKICSCSPIKCQQYAESWARALLILQSNPQIAHRVWRKSNPTITLYYMGIEPMTFDTEDLHAELNRIHHEAAQCQCINHSFFVLMMEKRLKTPRNNH